MITYIFLAQVPTEWVNLSCFESKIRQRTRQDLETKVFFVPEAVGSALHDTNLVVQAFHEPKGHLVLGLAEGGDTVPVALDHIGELLIRFEPLPF
jgi:hypothetical protein